MNVKQNLKIHVYAIENGAVKMIEAPTADILGAVVPDDVPPGTLFFAGRLRLYHRFPEPHKRNEKEHRADDEKFGERNCRDS